MASKQRGKAYPAAFWQYVEHAYQLNAVSDAKLCRDLGLDRKHFRDNRDIRRWQRIGERQPIGETEEATLRAYRQLVEAALSFKSGEFANLDALAAAAHPQSAADSLNARAAARHG